MKGSWNFECANKETGQAMDCTDKERSRKSVKSVVEKGIMPNCLPD